MAKKAPKRAAIKKTTVKPGKGVKVTKKTVKRKY